MSKYFTILTSVGAAKLANATALGETVKFTELALGDGNGSLPTPTQSQTSLVNEVRRKALNSVSVDDDNPNWVMCEQIIPEDVGGWTIREVGIYDDDGDLIAVGNFPETYKPLLGEGSGRTQTIRVVLQISSTSSVELKIDPSVVLATREYVDRQNDKRELKANAATNADIDAYSIEEKHINLPQYWRGIKSYVLNKLWLNLANLICPVGVPLPWPTDTAPSGFAIMKGQSFDLKMYPETAKAFPNGVLDDMRGLAIVGKKDDEVLLAYEADQVKSHKHSGSVDSVSLGTKTTSTNTHHHTIRINLPLYDEVGKENNHLASGGGQIDPVRLDQTYSNNSVSHAHTVPIGSHGHSLAIAAFGAAQNTIRNRKFNWIVRLA